MADAGTPNYTLFLRLGDRDFVVQGVFGSVWSCVLVAVPWCFTLELQGAKPAIPFWQVCASPVGQVCSVETRGQQAPLGSGSLFSHCIFLSGVAEGSWAPLLRLSRC